MNKMSFIAFLTEMQDQDTGVDPNDTDNMDRNNPKKRKMDMLKKNNPKKYWELKQREERGESVEAKRAGADPHTQRAEKLEFDAAKARKLAAQKAQNEGVEVNDCDCEYEIVYTDSNDNILTEASIRQFKRVGSTITRKYRCLSGPKAGKLVAKPYSCAQRKDPKKVRQGRKLMRSKKGVIQRKSQISKNKAMSRLVTKMNQRLSGK